MLSHSDLRALIRRELDEANLLARPAQYAVTARAVIRAGTALRRQLRPLVGRRVLRRGLAEFGWRRADAARVLGWGQFLTAYFVAPLDLPLAQRARVARLGALANLIVSLYDTALDSGSHAHNPLPPDALLALAGEQQSALKTQWAAGAGLLAALTGQYFRQLGRLAANAHQPHIEHTIRRAIWRMYRAENETLKAQAAPSGHTVGRELWVKAVYPFVVMGLPGWLAAPHIDPATYCWHVRWLFRSGQVFGWVDDLVDLSKDRASGQPNQIAALQASYGDDARLAGHMTHQTRRLALEWQQHAGQPERLPDAVRTAFSAALTSWFNA